jgi:hypothetical protein
MSSIQAAGSLDRIHAEGHQRSKLHAVGSQRTASDTGILSGLPPARDRHLHFALLSDFEPNGEIATRYLAIAQVQVFSERTLVLDRQGVIAWSYCSPIAVNPGADGLLPPLRNSQMRQIPMASSKKPITQNDHVRGPALAPITLVEYGDYECPHSAMAHSVVNQLKLHFKGQLRFAFRHLPLAEIHPQAAIAAESAEFTGAAGLLW